MSGRHILFGFHAVMSCLRSNPAGVAEVCVDKTRKDSRVQDLLQLAEAKGVRVIMLERQHLDGLAGNGHHQGVVARVAVTPLPYRDIHDILESDLPEPPLFLLLDGVEDPHNLGACLRVADAMGVHAVIAPKDRAVGLNATVRKVACGAAETVPFLAVTNLARTLRELKEAEVWVVGMTAAAEQALYSVKLTGPLALVLGGEGSGLRRLTAETCDELVSIPMLGTVESLNVSVACGICLYEARRQRSKG